MGRLSDISILQMRHRFVDRSAHHRSAGASNSERSLNHRRRHLAPMAPDTLPEGMTLRRRYRLVRLISRTAMSAVYLAHDLECDRLCVIKRLAPTERAPSPKGCERAFLREAAVLRALRGAFPELYGLYRDGFGWYMALEYIHGVTLEQVLAAGRPAAWDGLRIADGVLAALGELHGRRPALVYGDLHPRNVMIRPGGEVVLVDMGLARQTGADPPELRRVGTPGYASPEQEAGLPLDERSDIYSLAVLLGDLLEESSLPSELREVLAVGREPLRDKRRTSLGELHRELRLAHLAARYERRVYGLVALLTLVAAGMVALFAALWLASQ